MTPATRLLLLCLPVISLGVWQWIRTIAISALGAVAFTGEGLLEMKAFLWVPDFIAPRFRVGFPASAQYYFFVTAVAIVAYGASRK